MSTSRPTHLFVVGGNPSMAIILLGVTSFIAWERRQQTMNLLRGDADSYGGKTSAHGVGAGGGDSMMSGKARFRMVLTVDR